MDSALRERTWLDLEGKLDEAGDTIGRKRKLESMLEKVTEQQGTVPEHIFRKVQREYQEQLDEIRASLDPLESEIAEAKESIALEIDELETLIRNASDGLAELEFRFKVGEFDEAVYRNNRSPLDESLDEKIKAKQTLMASAEKIDSFLDSLRSASDGVPDGAPAESIAVEDQETSDASRHISEPAERRTPEPEFVNPNEWLDDFTGRTATDAGGSGVSSRKTDSELFEELLENAPAEESPDETPAPSSESGGGAPVDPAQTTPLLILKSKTGAEKRIPVLPITLTIGREHDNNIEIKDEDAARYHARIVFKNGQYLLQSLEGSRATLVNGKQITESVLQDADTITIGKTKMFFMME